MSEVSSEVIESLKLRPGEGLKRLREAAGLSLLDVAEATRITRSRIEALERDDYASAGQSPAHVIGYMRAYSRLLVISADPWLGVLERKLRQEVEDEQNKSCLSLCWWIPTGTTAFYPGSRFWWPG